MWRGPTARSKGWSSEPEAGLLALPLPLVVFRGRVGGMGLDPFLKVRKRVADTVAELTESPAAALASPGRQCPAGALEKFGGGLRVHQRGLGCPGGDG